MTPRPKRRPVVRAVLKNLTQKIKIHLQKAKNKKTLKFSIHYRVTAENPFHSFSPSPDIMWGGWWFVNFKNRVTILPTFNNCTQQCVRKFGPATQPPGRRLVFPHH